MSRTTTLDGAITCVQDFRDTRDLAADLLVRVRRKVRHGSGDGFGNGNGNGNGDGDGALLPDWLLMEEA